MVFCIISQYLPFSSFFYWYPHCDGWCYWSVLAGYYTIVATSRRVNEWETTSRQSFPSTLGGPLQSHYLHRYTSSTRVNDMLAFNHGLHNITSAIFLDGWVQRALWQVGLYSVSSRSMNGEGGGLVFDSRQHNGSIPHPLCIFCRIPFPVSELKFGLVLHVQFDKR